MEKEFKITVNCTMPPLIFTYDDVLKVFLDDKYLRIDHIGTKSTYVSHSIIHAFSIEEKTK